MLKILFRQLSFDWMVSFICGNRLSKVLMRGLFSSSNREPMLLKLNSAAFELDGLGGGVV